MLSAKQIEQAADRSYFDAQTPSIADDIREYGVVYDVLSLAG